jgi:hypothetical protein
MGTNREEWKQEIRAGQEHLKKEMKAQVASLICRMDAQHEGAMACLGRMEATDLEAHPEEIKSLKQSRR